MAGLGPYVIKRLIQAVITLFVVTSIVWALFEAMPGDPTDPFYANPNLKPGMVAKMAVQFGLAEQHLEYLSSSNFQPISSSEIEGASPNNTYYYTFIDFHKNPRAISFSFNISKYGVSVYIFSDEKKVPVEEISMKENATYKWADYSSLVGKAVQTAGVLPKRYTYVLLNFSKPNAQFPSDLKIVMLYVTDTPLYVRYIHFVKDMFTFNFGRSIRTNQPVRDILADRIPRTLLWFGTATILTYLIGIPIGTYIAWRRGGIAEGVAIGTSLFFYNMPSFWLGLVFIWIFSYTLGWTPIGGYASGDLTGPGTTCAKLGICPGNPIYPVVDYGWHLLLPLLLIVLLGMAGIILLQRTSMLETMGEDYILTAKAKGLPEKVVRNKHARRNAMLPVVTAFVLSLSTSIGGAVILEQIFSYEGVGYTYLTALTTQDFFLAGASLYIISLLVILGNLIADILYGFLDPRVRLQ